MGNRENAISHTFRISSYDLDPGGKARLTSIASFFQEMAYQHAGMLGFGFNDLKRNNTFWVLSRLKIRMERYPAWDDPVEVETWHRGMDRLFGLRDFVLSDLSGETLGIGSTAWLILDSQTRRPVREVSGALLGSGGRDRVFDGSLEKIILPGGMKELDRRKVLFSDLDIVGHVNNVKYIEWCIDTVRGKSAESRDVRELEINYIHEALLGDEIRIMGDTDSTSDSYFVAAREGDDIEVFRARLSWVIL